MSPIERLAADLDTDVATILRAVPLAVVFVLCASAVVLFAWLVTP